jgi:hypothetical protein
MGCRSKPTVLPDCNLNMGAVEGQLLQPYLLEQEKGSKWYMKLFKLLIVAGHNSMIMYQSIPNHE